MAVCRCCGQGLASRQEEPELRVLLHNVRELSAKLLACADGMQMGADLITGDRNELLADWIEQQRAVAAQLLALTVETRTLVLV